MRIGAAEGDGGQDENEKEDDNVEGKADGSRRLTEDLNERKKRALGKKKIAFFLVVYFA
jgi:hypothetical protein